MLRDLSELKVGDPVVHVQHGIGRYGGLVNLDLGEGMTEFLLLEYDGGDKLYVPVSQLEVISRYSGAQPEEAPLHKLGSGQWDKARTRAAKQVRDTAAELLELYAKRAARQGHAFGVKQHDLEAFADGFGFEETADQAAAIARGRRRHDLRQADGPPDLRRRRLRQDRGRAARGLRRGRGQEAGRDPLPHHAAGRAALRRPSRTASPTGRCRIARAVPLQDRKGSHSRS